jgi:hypothetical protein
MSLILSPTIAHRAGSSLKSNMAGKIIPGAGLVADDNDRPSQLIGPESRQWENSRDELELVEAMDTAAIHIDHAITEESAAAVHEPDCPD